MKEYNNNKRNSVFGGIGVAALLCVLMVLMSWSAMVTNSDINNAETVSDATSETTDVKYDEIEADKNSAVFEPEMLGFDAEDEMLGMRTENGKVYHTTEGMKAVVSSEPMHYRNHHGLLVDLDATIKSSDYGYYVNDIYTPVQFGFNAIDGLSINFGEASLVQTGIEPYPVLVIQGEANDPQLVGITESFTEVTRLEQSLFTAPTEVVEIGGSMISYPLTQTMDLNYEVFNNKVKQEFVLNSLSPSLETYLEGHLDSQTEMGNSVTFGLTEVMILPENTQLWDGNKVITEADGVYSTPNVLSIVDSETGLEVAYIDAPFARDGSAVDETETKDALFPGAVYHIQVDTAGNFVEITTAVNVDWLVDDYTTFPVVIDPTVGTNTVNSDSSPGVYNTCVVEDVDCYSDTSSEMEFSYSSSYWGGYHQKSPFFDFTFTNPTALTVASVTANYRVSNQYSIGGADVPHLVIMEDCGGNLPDGDTNNLLSFANSAGCTGTPLAKHTPPPPPTGAPYMQAVSNGISGNGGQVTGFTVPAGGEARLVYNCGSWCGEAGVSVVEDPTGAALVYSWGHTSTSITSAPSSTSGFSGSPISTDANQQNNHNFPNAGIFLPGVYDVYHWDSYGDGSNGGTIEVEIAPLGFSAGTTAPVIPAAAAGVGPGTPTGAEPADTTFTVASGEEAYFSFTTGTQTGDANEVEIYYRTQGSTTWVDKWDLCDGTDCQATTLYESYTINDFNSDGTGTPTVLLQTPAVYELLVWDTAGDGSGAGAGGTVQIVAAGTSTGVVANSPSGMRLVSLVSSAELGDIPMPYGSGIQTTNLCGSFTACNTGEMLMFSDAYTNGGYIEFGLGFPQTGLNARATFTDFYLTLELEDTTPDAAAPTTVGNNHYTGVTSYITGERSLFITVTDTDSPIDTTAGATQLHYSTDSGNSYTAVSADMISSSCASKNTPCSFSAATGSLSAGDSVDYYWTYSDGAAYDNNKIPPQTPNPGRFPATGVADLTFTIGDIYQAPTDGSAMKITTYMDNIRSAEPHTGVSSSSYAADVDRMMTYYGDSGEFHFEFGLDNCGANFGGFGGVPGTDGQGNCFFDIDAFSSYGEDSGHWDVNWEGAANACYPGSTDSTCANAPTNNFELDAHFGGPIAISGLEGAGNLVFVYDATGNNWMVSSTGTGIAATLDSSLPDVNSMATFTSNIITPVGPSPVTTRISNGVSGYGFQVNGFTVAAGDVGRLVYNCGSYCSEGGLAIQDTATGTVYDMGRNSKRSGGFQTVIGTQCSSSSGFSGSVYSDNFNGPCNSVGLIAAGVYNLFHYDYWGDGSNGGTIDLQTITASVGFGGGSAGPYESNVFNGRSSSNTAYQSQSYVIDLASTSSPVMGTNTGFGGVPLGGASGEFNLVCVTTAGHVIFMDGTDPECTPDAAASSAGGQWQGFALGAGKTNFQYQGSGMLWQIRDIQPDPDSSAPVLVGGEIGDSHALDRTITVTIGDTALYDSGLDVSPVPGVGPSIAYTVTSDDGTVSTSTLAMTPDGDRNSCADLDCVWTVDIDSLQRGDSVSYYLTAQDTYPLGANTITTSTYSFDVGNPTNSLVIEWFEYSDDNSATTEDCSMQIVMYDETDEFEYHYDDNCYVYEDVGLIGVRESQSNFVQVQNNAPDNYITNNPHSQNIRFTLTDSGDYAYEYFDLGIDYLPIASSNNAIPAGSGYHSTDTRCDSASDMAAYGVYCAGNFDLPDDFDFDFYGQNYDGTDPLNRVHVSASGMIYFINDGSTTINQHQGTTGSSCWGTSGVMCDLDSTSSYYPDNMMAPFWSRENLDICYTAGGRDCNGVWYRVLPFDGQGTTESDDITDDTIWYLIDSPIKVQPSSPDGYLSVTADLEIQPGVEVIIGENMGISFDGGIQADGTCAKFKAVGSGADRITFNADRTINPNAQWHGFAFTDDCGGQGETARHVFDMVDISNTNHAAITAGSRPADPNGPSCGTATQDCDIGEFVMNDVTYTNVDSAFSHGSGQGTVVTMTNFAVTDARSSCFNFAENTVASLTGTALNPSTMTRCNTNNLESGGAIINTPGSDAGELTLQYVNIVDSYVSLIRIDLQTVTISDVTATMTNNANNPLINLNDETGVHLRLDGGANSDVSITNFDAQNYQHGRICAANSVILNNVNLGTGFTTGHAFDVDPYCGTITSVPGSIGANSVFDDVTAPAMAMYRTLPGTANKITTTGDFLIADFPAGTSSDTVEFTEASIGGSFTMDGCNADLAISLSTVSQLSSLCSSFLGTSSFEMIDSTITHTSSTADVITAEQTNGILVNVDITSPTASAAGPFYVSAGYDTTVFLIDVEVNTLPCADNSGKTSDCHTIVPQGTANDGEIYYGGFANALAYRLGQDTSTTPPTSTQIPESGVTITASTLDATGAEILPGKTIYRSLTGTDGRTTTVAVITGDDNGVVYDSHLIRASGAAGAGEVHPDLADGTSATEVEFIDGTLQTNVPLADFGSYAMGSYADVRLVSPPVTLDDSGMNCAWMALDPYFSTAYDAASGVYIFKGATMVLAEDLTIDGCSVELKGSKIIIREDVTNNPTLTIANGGMLTMTIDQDTGDLPKIYGEGNLDAVDIVLNSGGTLNMEGGTMKNFLLSGAKAGHIVVPLGAVFNMSGGAYLTATDLSTGPSDYPMVVVDAGVVNVASSAFLAGSGNTGIGVELINQGEINGDGLTVSNMLTGINSDGGSINMDDYTSTANTNGVVAKDGPKLPEMFTSATLQGIAQNYPTQNFGSYYGEIPGMDNCWFYHMYACWEWYEYTVDLTSWVGQTDYVQPSMMLNYGGTWNYYYNTVGGIGFSTSFTPYITMDNLMIKVTDTSGNQYIVDDSTDAGYYPYGDNDPAVTGGSATYDGGQGGAPFWDCNYRGQSLNPWRFGNTNLNTFSTYVNAPSIGNLYGMSGNGYPDELGFRIGQGDTPEPIGVSLYPYFSWGFDDPINGRQGLGQNGPTNPTTWHQTSTGETRDAGKNYEACNARTISYASAGSNMMLEWPTLDLTDASIEKVELQFDMMHRYFGAYTNYHANNNRDSVELLARGGDDPASLGDYSEAIVGKGVILSNSQITDATVGVDLLGGTYAQLTNLDVDDPTSYAVRTSGANSVYLDGLDVDDSSAGANTNYGFYTESTSSGIQEIKNSDFNGLGTGIYLTNDVSTTITDTDVSNSNVGVRVGAQSSASHTFDNMILSNNDIAIKVDGTGGLTMTDVDITSVTTDLEITDTSTVKFLDGVIDNSKVIVATTATGYLNRDRSYFAVLSADGNPIVNANVVLSSRVASTSSTGSTDATGLTSGLSFSVYDFGASGLTDYSNTFSSYNFSSVAKISYSWTDTTTNDGDFRYIQNNPTMVDLPADSGTNTNYDALSLVNQIDVRVCGDDANYVMVAPCSGTLSSSSSRVYSNGMIEYGDAEGLNEGTSTMDLTGKAIMIDTGTLELKDGVNYILDNAIIFDTGYTTQYGDGFAQWLTDVPYGTTLTMNGGQVNGLYPVTETGDVVGLIIGGLQGSGEGALNLDIDGVSFNNIAGIATGTGDRTSSSFSGSFNTYIPSVVSIENSFINHYRGYFFNPAAYSDGDYCLRLQGTSSATISGNTFSDCTIGISFLASDWHSSSTTTVTHEQIGSDNVVIDGNTFNGASGYNIMAWPDSDADLTVITNNVMTCNTCLHVRYMDDSSVAPSIEGNTFNGGSFGVYTDDTEYVDIENNVFNNQANMAIRASGGDIDAIDNTINDAGLYAVYADSLEKPGEVVESVVAGVSSPQPDDGVSFISWNGDTCPLPTYIQACTSPDVSTVLAAGDELVIRMHEGGSWASELSINWKDPNNLIGNWDPANTDGSTSHDSGTPSPLIFDIPGVYTFNLEDSYGDGANGGGFEIISAAAGSWASGQANNNPKLFWDPGVAGLLTVEPGYRGPYVGYAYSPAAGLPRGYSNTMDGILIQNNGADPVDYELMGIDQWGDGWNGNFIRAQVAPVGTWSVSTTGYPPISNNYGGPYGTSVAAIGITASYPNVPFTSGRYSAPVSVTLDAGYEMRFQMNRGGSWAGEVALQIQEGQAPDNSWTGPKIYNNDINFDSANNNPNAIGLYLSNCDIQDYTIATQSNTIDIGQNAVFNNGCAWSDQSSTFTGSNLASSIGYNDDNTFNVDLSLDGTTITGFETGLYKAGGGTLTITNGATITAGAGGMGVHTDGIDVSVIDATFDGGATGTGIMVDNSQYGWFYPMDVTGNVGLHAKNSDILWDAGNVDATVGMVLEGVTGNVQSLTETASVTTQIDAQTNTRLTVIDYPLDETLMLVDSTSIVDEANWLNLDVDHLGSDPTSQVGVSIMADLDYTAYSSPIFGATILVDGAGEDWVGGNALNPSGYAMPGSIGGPMLVTVDGADLVFGFDSVSTATSDVYIYVDSNDNAGSTTGYNDVHTLPYPADFAIVVNAQGSSVYYYNAPSWVLDASATVISAEGAYLELSVPISALGGSSVDTMNIVSTVQMTGTNDVSAVSPTQTIVGSGAETLDGSYELVLNKLDLNTGSLTNEVLLHRSFEFSNVPTTAYTYEVMVKTAAETRHTCDFDWADQSAVTMDVTKTLTFDILRACPEITTDLRDVTVDEDTGAVSLDLESYVDDEQDVEANMEWDVTGDNMDAFAGILTDFVDLTAATGTYTITPINDQFGTFEMEFVVVDSHGQTDSKTIVYTVLNINDAPVICDARQNVDPNCDNGDVYLYSDVAGQRYNSRDEGFTSYSKPLGKDANDTINSFIRDMANEQFPVSQDYTWGATSDCDQISVSLQPNANGVDEIVIIENQAWEEGGICDITLTLEDDGAENQQASTVVIPFSVTPVNDEPVIAVSGQVPSADASNSFTGELNGNYRVTLVEDTTDSDELTFDLSAIKSDIDHVDAELTWVLEDTNTCTSSNYYSHSIVGDTLSFDLITDATTNAEPWEVDMLNNNGIHQTRTANGYCEMTLTLFDHPTEPTYMPNYTALSPNNYVQESVSVTLAIKVDNVVENVPDYYLDDAEGFDFNGVNNIMPGTWVPVDFSIGAGGDDGAYTYDHLLKVTLQTDGHTETQLPRLYTPPAFGTSLDIDDWEVYVTDQTTEVWVEVDVVTCNPGQVCTPASNSIQTDSPESHNAVSGNQVFGKWSEPGRIGESADGTQSNRRPAFEDKNWCNNLMTSNAAGTTVAWSEAGQCGHTEQGYGGAILEDWQTGDNKLPVTVSTIGALSVASFAPSIIAVALTGMFVSALVLSGRRDDDEEDFMEETISDDESAVSPVIATILMVAITVVLSGVVYVWAAQLADTDTKGVPVVTFSAENVDAGSIETSHWKITIGQAQTVLATQAVEVTVAYINATGGPESQTINLASPAQVYGFTPYNSDSLVTFADVVTIDGEEVISTFSTGDDIYVKTHLFDGTPLVDATIRIVYNPPGDAEGATLKTYRGLSWNQAV